MSYVTFVPLSGWKVSCGVAKLVRHRTVNAAIEGSNPSATANLLTAAMSRGATGKDICHKKAHKAQKGMRLLICPCAFRAFCGNY